MLLRGRCYRVRSWDELLSRSTSCAPRSSFRFHETNVLMDGFSTRFVSIVAATRQTIWCGVSTMFRFNKLNTSLFVSSTRLSLMITRTIRASLNEFEKVTELNRTCMLQHGSQHLNRFWYPWTDARSNRKHIPSTQIDSCFPSFRACPSKTWIDIELQFI